MMNLLAGKRMGDAEALLVLDTLRDTLPRVLEREPLSAGTVIRACGQVSAAINEEEHLPLLLAIGFREEKAKRELAMVKEMLSEAYLRKRLARELGETETVFPGEGAGAGDVTLRRLPLGVLFHIAAGNADALPVFSVLEGLLTGNINLLKLPGGGDELSLILLERLMEAEPALREYVYVFDTPSEDVASMRKMADLADAIVIWGSDPAIRAVRTLAEPKTKIIEWGHKISFAYVSGDADDAALTDIAWHICDTEQLYCNSCQGIFLDTADDAGVLRFAKRFVHLLAEESARQKRAHDPFLRAQKTLELRTEELEAAHEKKRVFREGDVSVIVSFDNTLHASYMHRNCWVKPLPSRDIVHALFPYKNHLQTAALLCPDEDRARLTQRLLLTGIVRVTSARRMSEGYCGMPHDGVHALRCYTKLAGTE